MRFLAAWLAPLLALAEALSPGLSSKVAPPQVRFTDVAQSAGLDFRHVSGSAEKKYILETISGGVAWIDYDRDGWPDLYLVNAGRWEDLWEGPPSARNGLYRNNRDGTFTNVTRAAGVAGNGWGMGTVAADFDNDGWTDLYLCNYGPNILYRNNGDGTFSDVTAKAGVGDRRWSSSAAFADFDGDGWLDLYVTNYVDFDHRRAPPPQCQYRGIEVHCGPKGLPPAADVFFRNNGDGTFADVTARVGMAAPASYGLGAVWGDFDNDGDIDLYVANDSMANFLFRNRGNGTFEETGLLSGTAYNEDGKAQAGMGVDFGDYDRDGLFDLFVTNFSDDYNTLYRNLGKGVFRDVAYTAAVAFPSWQYLGWGTFFFDYDHDGWEDLFVANGHIYPQVDRYQIGTRFAQRKLLFHNLGNGGFEEIAENSLFGLAERKSSRGAAYADFDNDGDLDVAVNNMDARVSLFRNQGGHAAGHWIVLALEGQRTNRGAVGVRVTVETEAGRQMREARAGSSYQSSHDPRLHFGVGSATVIRRLTVRWTHGTIQQFENVAANRRYALREGEQLTPHD